jgi:hypothetical protein
MEAMSHQAVALNFSVSGGSSGFVTTISDTHT